MRALSLAVVIVVSAASPAAAQPFNPRAACALRVDAIDFGVYSPNAAPKTSSGRVEVACGGPGVQAAIRIDLSPGRSSNYGDRTMANGQNVLHYNIFTDPGRQLIAGNGTSGTAPLIGRQPRVGVGRSVFRLYGWIPPGQEVPAGEYSDIINVTVQF
jgi:spore coat protein U-like protein